MTRRDRVLVFDFDGTVSLGLGPVRSYARFISEGLPIADATAFLAAVDSGLALQSHLTDDEPTDHTVAGAVPIDGYDLVRLVSLGFPVTAADRDAAYLRSRHELATDAAPVAAPTGLADFLAEAGESAHLVLATNAPDIRITETLDALGLSQLFDVVYTSVGKPAGLEAILDTWFDRVGALTANATRRRASPAHTVLSIGDVWVNDLAPAHLRGASTALVGSSQTNDATPTFRAEHIADLYPAIRAWLTTPVVAAA